MNTLTLPPIQYDPDIDQCLHTINLNMTPTEQPTHLQRLIRNYNWIIPAILTSYLTGLLMGAYLT